MITLTALAPDILASGSESEGPGLGLLLLLSGFVFYGYVFFRYRNADKRHRHESQTKSSIHNVETADHRVRKIRGSRSARMDGANNRRVRGAQHSFGKGGVGEQAISSITGSLFNR